MTIDFKPIESNHSFLKNEAYIMCLFAIFFF